MSIGVEREREFHYFPPLVTAFSQFPPARKDDGTSRTVEGMSVAVELQVISCDCNHLWPFTKCQRWATKSHSANGAGWGWRTFNAKQRRDMPRGSAVFVVESYEW